ncbi:protein indeterminate-domain 7-like [Elaeis guineensis]|uniref:Protein EARLY HEADING DATE 2 n=1 Tax=Elaeis guineensis var. tenera TaxID=51953 RepID=A0A6I9R7F6_ELAGV|nr:zinc finger protein GAI-ASSOCIATED FACTOR 1-like [Elaeis guineensis]
MTNITGDGGSFSFRTNTGKDEVHQHHQQQQLHHHIRHGMSAAGANSSVSTSQLPPPPIKKKRNLPGTPDPTAEVIALSPKTLMATNRFICEICHKGFQRDQNLQLHRRCHNLPWKLRPQTSIKIRKRVYVCPEPTCVHHNPSRALGDLTGIKKHYCRKHGEKKWNCGKCSKKYAVQSDWKAHSKICGTREYKCDCGTIFSRRESFITHRVFCDALVQENKLNQPLMVTMTSSLQGQAPNLIMPINTNAIPIGLSSLSHNDVKSPPLRTLSSNLLPTSFQYVDMAETFYSPRIIPSSSLRLSGSGPMAFNELGDVNIGQSMAGSIHMSATALLQKATQIGATASKNTISSTMMHGSFTSIMAGPDRASGSRPYGPTEAHGLFDQMQRSQGKQSQLVRINGGITNQFYDPSVNHIGLFRPIGMPMIGRDDGLLRNVEHGGDGGPGGGHVTMVDFLGVGEERSLHWQKPQQAIEYGGIGHQQRLEVFHPFQH